MHGATWYARITIGSGQRKAVALPGCTTQEQAKARAELMAELVAELRRAGRVDFIATVLEKVPTLEGRRLAAFVQLTQRYAAGLEARKASRSGADRTFRDFATCWTCPTRSSLNGCRLPKHCPQPPIQGQGTT